MNQPNPSHTLDMNLEQALLLEQARRKQLQSVVKAETEAMKMFKILRDTPEKITQSKALFKKACEAFLWISTKERGIRQFKLNRSQEIFLDAYFEMKHLTPAVRINILKGRQQGMSTMIAACAVIEMLAHPNTRCLIQSEEKGGSGGNIFMMYTLFFEEFARFITDTIPEAERQEWNIWTTNFKKRFSFGHECELPNRAMFSVVGEKPVTSRTLQFIHLSEAAFFNRLMDSLGMLMQTIPATTQSAMFIETTAKMYGNDYHDAWLAACEGKSTFLPLFIAWFNHEQYSQDFKDHEERTKFIESLSDNEESEFGNEKGLLELDTSNASWRNHWEFKESKIIDRPTLENMNWRRIAIRNLNGNIDEFNRQYPSTPEMAFLSKSKHVLDMEAVRWYEQFVKKPKDIGILQEFGDGSRRYKYVVERGGVLKVWEHPMKFAEYIIGIDVAEGLDSGDFSVAYVCKRFPFQIVAVLRGYDGRRLNLGEFSRQCYLLGNYYNTATICPENNGGGEALCQLLGEWGYQNMMPESVITGLGNNPRFGWRSTGGLRELGVGYLQEVIEARGLGIPDEGLIQEFYHFVRINGKAQAARKGEERGDRTSEAGYYDDRIFALIGAILANKKLPRARTEQEIIYDHNIETQRVKVRDERNKRSWDIHNFI